jgi:hypothetical protein
MTAYYACTAEIHFPKLTPEMEDAINELGKLVKWACDASIEQTIADDGTVWMNIQFPEQNCGHGFIGEMDANLDNLARFALDGFHVEYEYESEPGVDFYGPTPEAKAQAKREWNLEKATQHLQDEGIDLQQLLALLPSLSSVSAVSAEAQAA